MCSHYRKVMFWDKLFCSLYRGFLYSEFPLTEVPLYSDPQISSKSSLALCSLVPHDKRIDKPSPLWRMKAIKNSAELAGMRDANVRILMCMCTYIIITVTS